jgi:hypothetical protein
MTVVYVVFLFFAIYNAGCMTALQIQHYGIYHEVGPEHFPAYVRANNRAAVIPTILPALLLLVLSVFLAFLRPPYMRLLEAIVALVLNLAALVSTFTWQRPIQAHLAETGYNTDAIQRLTTTNWIRTVSYLLIGIDSVLPVFRVLAEHA